MAAKKSKAPTKQARASKKPVKKTAAKQAKKVAKKSAKKSAKKVAAKPKKKAAASPAKKAKPSKKKTASKKRTPPSKKATKPPMHNPVNHPELDDEAHGSEAFEIFRVYDRDASGSIDREEFVRLLEALSVEVSEDELAVALNEVDQNHSGKISWREFKTWWEAR